MCLAWYWAAPAAGPRPAMGVPAFYRWLSQKCALPFPRLDLADIPACVAAINM